MRDASPAEFDALVVSFLPVLRRKAARLARGRTDVDDLIQDALVRAYRCRATLRTVDGAGPWLSRILLNTFLDRLRRRRVRRCEVELTAEPAAPVRDEAPWAHLSVDDVRAALAELPEDMRDAYAQYTFEGRGYAAIAAATGLPTGTVATRILRARRALRARLAAAA